MFHCLEYDLESRGNKMKNEISKEILINHILSLLRVSHNESMLKLLFDLNALGAVRDNIKALIDTSLYCDEIEDLSDDQYEIIFTAAVKVAKLNYLNNKERGKK